MSLQKTPFYVYDEVTDLWTRIEWHKQPLPQSEVFFAKNLKIATFNVLFDLYNEMEPIIHSEKRFIYQFSHIIPNIDADILALQEVTYHYLGKLLSERSIKQKFKYCTMYSDKLVKDPEDKMKNFVVILSKVLFKETYNCFIGEKNCYRAVPVVVLQHKEAEFTICAVHLKAKFAFDKERQHQIDDLLQVFGINERIGKPFQSLAKGIEEYNTETQVTRTKKGKLAQPALKRKPNWREFDNVILLGDINMQQAHEEEYFPTNVIDVWKHLRPNEIGFTNDPLTNIMARKIGEAKVKVPPPLRLDRILILPRNKFCTDEQHVMWEPIDVCMFATDPISLDDINDIYASDHYGLLAELNINT